MWLVISALRRPITVVVAVLALVLVSILALRSMQVDIFPNLGAPAIYVAAPFGGLSPAQMESFVTYNFEYHFFYIAGIDHVESKTIQGAALMKLVFRPETDMTQALAQVVASVNRSRAFMPPGSVAPFVTRFDAGSVPVAQLVFSSPSRNVGEMQDIAVTRVRPFFASLPGVSAPPPFGASQRTVVVRLEPEKLRAHGLSPEDAIAAIGQATAILPAGNLRSGEINQIVNTNASIGANIQDFLDAPIRGSGPGAVYLRDIGSIELGTDITNGYAHVNGRRTVYIPVTKRADASTLAVVEQIRKALPAMRNLVPEDVDIRLEFDQSRYVANAIRSLYLEGLLGAALTALMVLVFLRDWRSGLIVISTIPFALLGAVVGLWVSGQTINIMTLGGLALAIGVLVDEATVEIENIHTHIDRGLPRALAVVEACKKTAIPRLLSMLSILSVFVPSVFMAGVGRQLFVPLSIAVGFAMIASYVLSSTLVPVLSAWMMRKSPQEREGLFRRIRDHYAAAVAFLVNWRWGVLPAYALAAVAGILFLWPRIGTEIFPTVDTGQLQLRMRAKTGTRIERTETLALKTLDLIQKEVGPENVAITTGYIGTQPSGNPVNTIYLWTTGPHEAVLKIALKPGSPLRGDALKERLRERFRQEMPGVAFSFEPGDIVSQVMSFGSPTPIEVAVQGPNVAANLEHCERIRKQLESLPGLRDLQYSQPLDYPTVDVSIDRNRAALFGYTAASVARSLVAATSSSRFLEPNFWRDPATGNSFQIQVEIPQNEMRSAEDLLALPLSAKDTESSPKIPHPRAPLLRDLAVLDTGATMGQVDRYNMQRVVSLSANLEGQPLGRMIAPIREAIARAGEAPRGVMVALRGQAPALEETLAGLRTGLLLAIASILLLLAANFQSFRLALAIVAAIPAVVCGVLSMLLLTGSTMNVQSFMGMIMACGISVANSILLVTFAEFRRQEGATAAEAAVAGAKDRLRAILMTASTMFTGMIPLAIGWGEGAGQVVPLGRAVIGGLLAGTAATLLLLPVLYAVIQRAASPHSASLDPSDPRSRYFVPATEGDK
jgi:multidrug efflux pump subunit AcrB